MICLLVMTLQVHIIFAQVKNEDKTKIEEYQEQLEKHKQEGNTPKELEFNNKIAFIYWQNNVYDKAAEHFTRSLELNQQMNNQNGIKSISYYLGMIYSEQDKLNEAVTAFERGIKISREQKMKNSVASGLINLAQAYQNAGEYQKSNQNAHEALEIAQELEDLEFTRNCYGLLSENYKNLGDSEESMKYFDLYSSVDKHLKNREITNIKEESQGQILKAIQEKSQTEQQLAEEQGIRKRTEDSLAKIARINRERQMQLEMNQLELDRKQAQLKLEKTIRNGLLLVIAIAIIFSILLYYFYKQKKEAYKLLEKQNEKINEQNIKIQEQKDELQIQNTKLNDSISYAQNIQQAILPIQSDLNQFFDAFIMYKPKDVVSGDFYWYTEIYDSNKKTNRIFLAVVDCTGHGVPGAFMSMIGNRIFNELINEKNIYDPSKILYYLNQYVIEALKQKHTDNTDGMDVCLIVTENNNKDEKIAYFAGAKRPLYLFSQKDQAIKKINGDRYSIGGISKNKNEKQFSAVEVTIRKGDIIYLTSDGMVDQVNSSGKRFGTRRFQNLLQQNAEKPLSYQKAKLEEEFDKFQTGTEQRDDITIIGAKIV
ncbi:MAG: SpoIIE family protein phosphatase [Bacteroidales bacterium]